MPQHARKLHVLAAAIAAAGALACGAVAQHAASPQRALVVPRQLNAGAPLPRHVTRAPRRSLVAATRGWYTLRRAGVAVTVSPEFPEPEQAAERWAGFVEQLVHGSEIGAVTLALGTAADVWALCGPGAYGCYVPTERRILAIGDDSEGVRPEAVVAHEYGHHVAASRDNAPWKALDWGAKRWASAMGVCAGVRRHRMFPDDQGSFYHLNPGEAFAETYRVLNGQELTPGTDDWPIVAAFFRPNERLLRAIRRDVLEPWHDGVRVRRTGRLDAAGAATVELASPLDGTLEFRVQGATAGGSAAGERAVCGKRSTTLRLAGKPGARYVLTAHRP